MKSLKLSTLLLGTALFIGLGTLSLNASDMKCGAGKCGDAMEKSAKKCGDAKKCGGEKKAAAKKCGGEKKTPTAKCGTGKCGTK